MSAFNTSTKTDNISVRLKAQNIKNAQTETKKLELESRKMEERLRELKVAMGKEKEEREKHGGFWKRGKSGSLNSYATDVLEQQKTTKEPKKRGVKLLKDEKIVLPNRSGEPGTLKHIADSDQINRDKPKGPKCGQCEERSASVSCVQCSEYFCAGCFTAFHYKGALKRHRTITLQASGPRQCMSPRVSAPPSYRSPRHGSEASAVSSSVYQNNGMQSPVGASGSLVKSTLLSGEYNEDESAASFQNALQAWRHGESVVKSPERKRVISTNSPNRPVSRVLTPTVKTESSTGTVETKEPIEIKFTNHSVSYADRLLLKKHRRTDVDHITTPETTSSNGYYDDQAGELDRVDFQSLYQAMVPGSATPNSQCTTESSLSIIELDNMPKRKYRNVEQTSNYHVEEVSDYKARQIQNSASSMSLKQSEVTSKSSPGVPEKISLDYPVTNETKTVTKRPPSSQKKKHNSNIDKQEGLIDQSSHIKDGARMVDSPRPTSTKSKAAQKRPSSARSRPVSRAKSRALSRLQIDGVLTKTPTPALQSVANMADREKTSDSINHYRSVFGDFFANNGNGISDTSRAVTPLPDLIPKKKDFKVSYTLYQMAPRSWKPDSTLGENIPPETVLPELSEAVLACLPDASVPMTPEKIVKPQNTKRVPPRREHDDENMYLHEGMNQRSHRRFLKPENTRKRNPVEEEFQAEFEREVYSRNKRENTDLMSPIRLEEISCNTETPQPEITSGRESRGVVIMGDDYSSFDVDNNNQAKDDEETLDKLEWELASESGRITADGKISRLSLKSDSRSGSSSSTVRTSFNSNDQGYDINTRLREDELQDESDDETNDTEDVLALN